MRDHYDFKQGKRGAVIASPGKTRITIMLDDDVIDHFRSLADERGVGYQTMINTILRTHVTARAKARKSDRPVDEATLRRVIREELKSS